MRRAVRLGAWLALLLALIGVVTAAALLVRLRRGPIDIPFLTTRIQERLARTTDLPPITIGATRLALAPERHRVELHVDNVVLHNPDGSPLLTIPSIAILPSLSSLIEGEPRIGVAEILSPHLQLVRRTDGSIGLTQDAAAPAADVPATGVGMLAAIYDPSVLPSPLRMRRFAIDDAAVTITDTISGTTVQAEHASLNLRRHAGGTEINLHATLIARGSSTVLSATARTVDGERQLQVHAELSGVVPTAWQTLVAGFANLDLPLEVRADTTLDSEFKAQRIDAQLSAGQGKVAGLPGDVPLVVQSGSADLSLDLIGKQLQLRKASLTTSDVEVQASGQARQTDSGTQFDLDARLPRATLQHVLRYWPPTAATAARQWVADNIRSASLRAITASIGGGLDTSQVFRLGKLDGKFDFEGLSVRVLDGFPTVDQIAGNATFSPAGLNFNVGRGTVAGVRVTRSTVQVSGLDSGRPRLTVDAGIDGTQTDVVALLNRKPIQLPLKAENFGGTINGRVGLDFALDKPITLAALGLSATAKLKDSRLQNVAPWEITNGDFDLSLRDTKITVGGEARVGGAPARGTYAMMIGKPETRTVDANAVLDDAVRVALGYDTGSWVRGPIALSAQMSSGLKDTDVIQLKLDLRDARIDGGAETFTKEAGRPGTAEARLQMVRDQLSSINRIQVSFDTTKVSGSARRSGNRWQAVDLQGSVVGSKNAKPGRATLTLRPAGDSYQFRISADDAGALLSFDDKSQYLGGNGTFAGTVNLDHPPLGLNGHLDVHNLTVKNAPVLARIVSFASLGGMRDALFGNGLPFENVSADMTYQREVLTISKGLATSTGTLLRVEGSINSATMNTELKGTLVPSYYGLNQAANKIPLIGGLLGKVTGDGIQAFDFRVTGPLSDPSVHVQASSLAPGALRDLIRMIEP